jgi:hypothetical protein
MLAFTLYFSVKILILSGCKHSKVDQESAPVYGSHDFLGQTPVSSSKMLFKMYTFHDDLYC